MRKPPCEVRMRYVLPALRMALATILEGEMGLSSYRVAKILGITPAALSNYKYSRRSDRRMYDMIMKDESYVALLRTWAKRLVEGEADPGSAICTLCQRAPVDIEHLPAG